LKSQEKTTNGEAQLLQLVENDKLIPDLTLPVAPSNQLWNVLAPGNLDYLNVK